MSRPILNLIACLALALALPAQARTVSAQVRKITTPMATLQGVRVQLDWPANARQGRLRLQANDVVAPDLGYRFRDLDWQCPLQRVAKGGWRCDGVVRAPGAAPKRLMVHFDARNTDALLQQNGSRLALRRDARTPQLTELQLVDVPVAWAKAFVAQGWPSGTFSAGRLDADLDIRAPRGAPLQVAGPIALRGTALQTRDGGMQFEGVDARLRMDLRTRAGHSALKLDGTLAGEGLVGEHYFGVSGKPAAFSLQASKTPASGWRIPALDWRDGETLHASGSLAFSPQTELREMDLTLRSPSTAGLRDRYLSAWLGRFGMADVQLAGAVEARLRMAAGRLQEARATLQQVSANDPRGRFNLAGLQGDIAFSGGEARESALRWRSAHMYGLEFGETALPFRSEAGVLHLREDARLPFFGGQLTLHDLHIAPPRDGAGLGMEFGLQLDGIDFGQMAKALGLPAFRGELNGEIPKARYANDVLSFDGGLSLGLFDGAVQITQLQMERPFGTAPSLSADIDFNDLDLLRLTEVLGFGSITGKLDGHIHQLRLVGWEPVRFDAAIVSDRKPGVRQRISQRAVQNISSVGDASFVTSLQGQLIGLFNDFGYRRLGIACRLVNEVCVLRGVGEDDTPRSDSAGFTIVEGAGIPRLTVVGFNRRVDWPTLLERLKAVAKGDSKPVID